MTLFVFNSWSAAGKGGRGGSHHSYKGRSRSPKGRYRRSASLATTRRGGARGEVGSRTRTRSPPRRFLLQPKRATPRQPCRDFWGSLLPRHGPDGHGSAWSLSSDDPIPGGSPQLQAVQEARDDPMRLEALLSWSPEGPGDKAASPVFQPAAVWLPTAVVGLEPEGGLEADDAALEAADDGLESQARPLVEGQARPLMEGQDAFHCLLRRSPSLLGPTPVAPAVAVPEPPSARRSSRLAAKNPGSRGGAAKQTSLLLEKRLANLGHPAASAANSARERLAQLFLQPLQPEVISALKALAGVEGKAQVNLPALGLSAEDLSALAKEVAAPSCVA